MPDEIIERLRERETNADKITLDITIENVSIFSWELEQHKKWPFKKNAHSREGLEGFDRRARVAIFERYGDSVIEIQPDTEEVKWTYAGNDDHGNLYHGNATYFVKLVLENFKSTSYETTGFGD